MMRSEIVVKEGRVYHLGLAPHELASRVILVGDPARTERVAAHFDHVDFRVRHREYVTITGRLNGKQISVIGTGMSTDNVEVCLAEMYTLYAFDLESGLRRATWPDVSIIRVGTSGGVQEDIPSGTLAISSYALGLDSTGIYFEMDPADQIVTEIEEQASRILKESTPETYRFWGRLPVYASKADANLVTALQKETAALRVPYVTGIIATTPGFYGPSARKIKGIANSIEDIKLKLGALDCQGHRIVNMDMESSLLFHLGALLGFSCATICPIISGPSSSDRPIDYAAAVDHAIAIALRCLGS
ncbi:MAG: hypothetical protein KTR24_09215 [Saprospiraceae bacterium]|nr:hypothetical protein [Saprospiraceae bacterium]